MKRLLAVLLVGTSLASCAAHTSTTDRPSFPTHAEIVGERLHIESLKREAQQLGWTVECEGQLGSYSTLRIAFPPDANEPAIEAKFGPDAFLTQQGWLKLQFVYTGMRRTEGACATW